MKESSAVLPREVWRLVSKFDPRLQLDRKEKSLAWASRVKKKKKRATVKKTHSSIQKNIKI